jgi:hypothetical protein
LGGGGLGGGGLGVLGFGRGVKGVLLGRGVRLCLGRLFLCAASRGRFAREKGG